MRQRHRVPRFVWIIAVIFVLLCGGLILLRQFSYWWEPVEENQLGVQLAAGRIIDVVGPGIYSATGYRVDLQPVNIDAVPFTYTDPEIITFDKQKIGLTINGDIFRPNDADQLRSLWSRYKNLFINDEIAIAKIQGLAGQAMKVCVGNRTFDSAVIGEGRGETRSCIDSELNQLAGDFGLTIANVVIPDVTLDDAASAQLDSIVKSRLEAERWKTVKKEEQARTEAELAKEQGKIRVEQGRLEQQARSAAAVAAAEEERILAQKAVIEAEAKNELARAEADFAVIRAEKANELEAEQLNQEIAEAKVVVATLNAESSRANEAELAKIISRNPDYGDYLAAQLDALALNGVEKVFMVPEGSQITVLSNGGGVPTVDAAPQANQ